MVWAIPADNRTHTRRRARARKSSGPKGRRSQPKQREEREHHETISCGESVRPSAFGKCLSGGGNRLGSGNVGNWRNDLRFARTGGGGDPGQASDHIVAFRQLLLQLLGHLGGRHQLTAEILIDIPHRMFEAADRALGDFGRGDQFGDRRFERMLVGLQALQAAIQQYAVNYREHEQNRYETLDRNSEHVTHWASIILVCSSAFSNIAKVVFGLRNCLATRMATRSPTRPIRPSVSVTLPQRTATSASARISRGKVSPTFSFISSLRGMSAS